MEPYDGTRIRLGMKVEHYDSTEGLEVILIEEYDPQNPHCNVEVLTPLGARRWMDEFDLVEWAGESEGDSDASG